VRVLLDPGQDVNRPGYLLLRRAGLEIRWYRPPPGAKLHAKAVLADDRLVLGSANWSRHGLDINHELDVQTNDRAAMAAYEARFELDWEAAA
jgi:phosphatidylserine/phosphatidylglycerophosphate/cardiolipin synthase-like enzyme